jgi:hypothetical protein
MIGEMIAIGDELTSGRIANTTSGHAAHHLFLLGHQYPGHAHHRRRCGADRRHPEGRLGPHAISSSSPAAWGRPPTT